MWILGLTVFLLPLRVCLIKLLQFNYSVAAVKVFSVNIPLQNILSAVPDHIAGLVHGEGRFIRKYIHSPISCNVYPALIVRHCLFKLLESSCPHLQTRRGRRSASTAHRLQRPLWAVPCRYQPLSPWGSTTKHGKMEHGKSHQ